jgi:FkbM family methyltransferase
MKALKLLRNKILLRVRGSSATPILKKIIPRRFREAAWNVVSSQDEFEVLGSWMYIPPESRSRDTVLNQYEPGVSACLKKILKPGMVFCDVGANFGIFTLFASKIVGPTGRVFAFEPVKSNRDVLERNIERNDARNVIVSEKAVSDSVGIARIFLSRDAGCHSISSEPPNFNGNHIDVDVVRLDKIKEIDKIDVLKIDVEGAELEVLSGLGDLQVKYVILEFNGEMISRKGISGPEFLEQLNKFGFESISNLDDPASGFEDVTSGKDLTVNLLLSRSGND